MLVTFSFLGPTGFTPAVDVLRRDTLASLGTGTASEAASGYYTVSIEVGSYVGDVVVEFASPSGSAYGVIATGITECRLSDVPFDLAGLVAGVARLGTGQVTTGAMVNNMGVIQRPIVIGDDYLVANGRGFEWTIDAIAGFSVGSIVVTWGGALPGCEHSNFAGTGTVTDLGAGRWKVTCELTQAATANCVEGLHDWSVQLKHSGVEITRIHNVPPDNRAKLIKKFT